MSMWLQFFALIKEVFTSVDYAYKINLKRWTNFYYCHSDYMLLYLINRGLIILINLRCGGKLSFYTAQTGCQQTNYWQFWRRVLSLHRERITMLQGTVHADIR